MTRRRKNSPIEFKLKYCLHLVYKNNNSNNKKLDVIIIKLWKMYVFNSIINE